MHQKALAINLCTWIPPMHQPKHAKRQKLNYPQGYKMHLRKVE